MKTQKNIETVPINKLLISLSIFVVVVIWLQEKT